MLKCLVAVGSLAVLLLWMMPVTPASANYFCEALDLPHCRMLGGAPGPTPCDIRKTKDPSCVYDPKSHHWRSYDPAKKEALEKALANSAPAGAIIEEAPFGRVRVVTVPEPKK